MQQAQLWGCSIYLVLFCFLSESLFPKETKVFLHRFSELKLQNASIYISVCFKNHQMLSTINPCTLSLSYCLLNLSQSQMNSTLIPAVHTMLLKTRPCLFSSLHCLSGLMADICKKNASGVTASADTCHTQQLIVLVVHCPDGRLNQMNDKIAESLVIASGNLREHTPRQCLEFS